MRELVLERHHYGDEITEGKLYLGTTADSDVLATLERPWQSGSPGGMPFASCVPDGLYKLRQHERKNGDIVVALVAPDLGVYYAKAERPDGMGRYKILIHSANWVDQVVGCIAPGLVRTINNNKIMVGSSRIAVARIMENIDTQEAELDIVSACGTNQEAS